MLSSARRKRTIWPERMQKKKRLGNSGGRSNGGVSRRRVSKRKRPEKKPIARCGRLQQRQRQWGSSELIIMLSHRFRVKEVAVGGQIPCSCV
jgi:hypothetical protein